MPVVEVHMSEHVKLLPLNTPCRKGWGWGEGGALDEGGRWMRGLLMTFQELKNKFLVNHVKG